MLKTLSKDQLKSIFPHADSINDQGDGVTLTFNHCGKIAILENECKNQYQTSVFDNDHVFPLQVDYIDMQLDSIHNYANMITSKLGW